MIIQKIKIHSFGKLKDFTLSFENGTNVVFGENEAGKSTILAFIKAMLYGFSGSKRSISDNERIKYMPWDGSKMSGELYFECALTKNGCIRRTFGKTAKGDTCQVIDNVTGETLPLSALGEEILEMNADTFSKTAFMKQLGAGISGKADDEIAKKMMNLEESADEEISYSKTKDCLLTQKRALKTIGNKGKISVLETELIQLQEQAVRAEKREEEISVLTDDINQLKAEQEQLQKQTALAEQTAWQADCFKIQEFHQKLQELRDRTKEIQQLQDGEQIQRDRELKNELLNRLQSAENEIAVLNAQKKVYHEQKPQDFEAVQERIEQLLAEQNNQQSQTPKRIALLSFAVIAIGALAGIFVTPYLWFVTLVGFLGLIWAKKTAQVSKNERENEILTLFSKIQVTNAQEYDKIKKEYNEIELKLQLLDEQLALKEQQIKKAQIDISDFCEQLKTRYNHENAFDLLDRFMLEKETLEQLNSEAVLVERAIEMVANGRPTEIFLKERVEKPAEIHGDSEQMKQRSIQLVRQIADCEHALEELSKERPLSLIRSDIAQKQEELRECKCLYQALETAEKEIDEAYKVLENDFRPRLNALAGENFQKITGGKYDSVRVSKDFNVLLECGNELRELDYMSGGTADQFYVALRSAFLELMETKEKIPFFLDDAFIQFDAKRTQNAFAFLTGQQTQILYFTCKEDILNLAQQNSIHCMEVLS